MSNVYFIADFHFGHVNIIEHCNRSFRNVEEMNESIIRQWSKKSEKDNESFVLGDFELEYRESISLWGKI